MNGSVLADVDWTHGTSGDWSTGSNWSTGSIPNGNTTNVNIMDGTSNVALNTSVSIASLHLASGNTLTESGNTQLSLYGPQITNYGQIAINGGGGTNTYFFIDGDTTLSGAGALTLNTTISGGGTTHIYNAVGGTKTLTNQSTIQGDGTIGEGTGLAINNSGTINANSTGGPLVKELTLNNVGGITNTGLLEATNSGILQLNSQTINNNSGNITANGANAVVQINGTTVQGGTLNAVNGGTLQNLGASTLDGSTGSGAITLNGTYTVTGNSLTTILGTINNNNNIQVNGGGGTNAYLLLGGNTTLQGGGTVTMTEPTSGGGNSHLYSTAGALTLTNVNNTIQGSGMLGQGTAVTFINQANGVVNANSAGGTLNTLLTINTGNKVVQNAGLLEATNKGVLMLNGTIDNSVGNITANGANAVVQISNAAILGGTLNALNGGTLQNLGASTLDGSTHGALTLNGAYTLTGGSQTTILGTINNTNNIQVNGGGGTNTYLFLGGNTTLQGGGTVTMTEPTSGGGNSHLYSNAGAVTLTNVNNTIQGSGMLGQGSAMTFVNQAGGVVNANSTGGALNTVMLVQNAGGTINQGLMEATNSGALQFSGYTINNTGANIKANSGTTVQFDSGVTLQGGTLTNNGGTVKTVGSATLDGSTHGALTLNGQYTLTSGSATTLLGTINNNNNIQVNGGGGTNTYLYLGGNTTLQGGGTVTMTTPTSGGGDSHLISNAGAVTLTNVNNTIQGSGLLGQGTSQTFINQTGGVVNANSTGGLLNTVMLVQNAGGTINQGLMEATNSGVLEFSGYTINNNGAHITANSGATVQLDGGVILQGGTLTNNGGTVKTVGTSTLDGSTHGALTLNGQYTVTNGSAPTILGTINNTGNIQVNGGGGFNTYLYLGGNTTLTGGGEITLNTNTNSGGDTHFYTNAGAVTLTNINNTIQGSGQLGQGTNMTLANGGLITANVSGQALTVNPAGGFTNTGTLQAINGGTLNASTAFTGTGAARVDGASQFNIGAASTVGNLINNGTTATALSLGTHDITVSSDYTNANFGVGNSFNNRANVAGTGQILAASGAAQEISGTNITNGTTTNATLTIGNVRVGSTTYDYQIANSGTGPSLRGAIQTTANGANLTDARLSGTGVTASNYNTGAPGSNTGNLGVTFTTNTAGALAPLSGQVLNLTSNFDNISDQKLNIVLGSGAAAYVAATGATTTPVQIANQRINGNNTAALTIANTSTGTSGFVEDLNASVGSVSGDASGSGSITGRLAGTNNTGNGAITVGVDTHTAGAKTGTVTLDYQTAGAVNGVSNSLGTASEGSQDVTVNGNVYKAATGAIQTAALNFGTVQVGQSVSQNLVIRNTATGPGGFVEDLNASFGSVSGTGANLISGTGSLNGILAGTNSNLGNGLMTVSVNTLSAGVVAGNIGVNYFTAGAVNGVSNGLGLAPAGSENYGVNGTIQTIANIINQASPLVNNPSINFGAMRVGDLAPTANVSVTNQATTAPQAALNASISSNGLPVTASGSFNLLAPGDTNPNQLQVGLDTGTAGNFTGANAGHATIALVSDASNVGGCGSNCQMTLASQDVLVSGKVYQKAIAQVNTTSVDFGIVHVNENVAAKNVSVTNSAPSVALNDVLTGTLSGATGPFTASGTLGNGLAAGDTSSNNSLSASLNTANAGVFTSNATASFQSHNGDMTDLDLVNATTIVDLKAQVNNYAKPVFTLAPLSGGSLSKTGLTTYTLDLGSVAQNSMLKSFLKLLNDATGPADFANGSFFDPQNGAKFTLTGFGSFSNLAADDPNGLDLSILLDTSNVGSFTDTITLSWNGTNADYVGNFANIDLILKGDVTGGSSAVPEPSTLVLAGIGLLGIGLLRRKNRA